MIQSVCKLYLYIKNGFPTPDVNGKICWHVVEGWGFDEILRRVRGQDAQGAKDLSGMR
jgi:hypothetical protein